MNIHILIHGYTVGESDPVLSHSGVKQAKNITLPQNISLIIAGTGKRFMETLSLIVPKLNGDTPACKFSPLCGSADSWVVSRGHREVILAYGSRVSVENYIGLSGTCGIDLVAWIRSLPGDTLLIAEPELIKVFGCEAGQYGYLYHYDGEALTPVV